MHWVNGKRAWHFQVRYTFFVLVIWEYAPMSPPIKLVDLWGAEDIWGNSIGGRSACISESICVVKHSRVGLPGKSGRAPLVMLKQDVWRAVTSSLCWGHCGEWECVSTWEELSLHGSLVRHAAKQTAVCCFFLASPHFAPFTQGGLHTLATVIRIKLL